MSARTKALCSCAGLLALGELGLNLARAPWYIQAIYVTVMLVIAGIVWRGQAKAE